MKHTRQGAGHGQFHKTNRPKKGGALEPERPPTPEFCWCGDQHGGEGDYRYAGDHPWGPLPDIQQEDE